MMQIRPTGLFLALSAFISFSAAADSTANVGHSCEEATRRLKSEAWQQCKVLTSLWSTPYLVNKVKCERYDGPNVLGGVTAQAYFLCVTPPAGDPCGKREYIRTKLVARYYETKDESERDALRQRLTDNAAVPSNCPVAGGTAPAGGGPAANAGAVPVAR